MIRSINWIERFAIINLRENFFADLKSKDIEPAKLSKSISAFANASGGEIFLGIDEDKSADRPRRFWNGFSNEEAANGFFQMFNQLDPLGNIIKSEFLTAPSTSGLVLYLSISKARTLIATTDGKVYRRVNAQNLPVVGEALDKLKLEKGILSYEDHVLDAPIHEVSNSAVVLEFLMESIPTGEPEQWLAKQFLLYDGKPTVASVLLFSDNPQAIMPKRSAVKVLRYQTKSQAERDFLVGTPSTIEGPIYNVIYESVDLVVTSRVIVNALPEQLGLLALPVLERGDGSSGLQG